jgi:adenylate cyclase class IV
MREVELKAVLDSWGDARARIVKAGATMHFAGRLEDRRYDTNDRSLAGRDIVLRLRTYRDARNESDARTELEFKGPSTADSGYKVREEIGSTVLDAAAVAVMLGGLGYIVTRGIDRDIEQFDLGGTMVRFERYPRMDDLVEVEGEPDAIERTIAVLGIPRAAFNTDRLVDFAMRYETRTGKRAALSDAELAAAAPSGREK